MYNKSTIKEKQQHIKKLCTGDFSVSRWSNALDIYLFNNLRRWQKLSDSVKTRQQINTGKTLIKAKYTNRKNVTVATSKIACYQ